MFVHLIFQKWISRHLHSESVIDSIPAIFFSMKRKNSLFQLVRNPEIRSSEAHPSAETENNLSTPSFQTFSPFKSPI
ncbi:unnamed protein product [Caenorhabditis nigoni]